MIHDVTLSYEDILCSHEILRFAIGKVGGCVKGWQRVFYGETYEGLLQSASSFHIFGVRLRGIRGLVEICSDRCLEGMIWVGEYSMMMGTRCTILGMMRGEGATRPFRNDEGRGYIGLAM